MFKCINKLYIIFKRKRKKSTYKNSKEIRMFDKNLLNSISSTQDSYDIIEFMSNYNAFLWAILWSFASNEQL
ncbi:unnamed protein product [Rhizophagus irregularis]|nr:unnamed protein product [Rhizophagus irregularis]